MKRKTGRKFKPGKRVIINYPDGKRENGVIRGHNFNNGLHTYDILVDNCITYQREERLELNNQYYRHRKLKSIGI